jgi:hypothetical protein
MRMPKDCSIAFVVLGLILVGFVGCCLLAGCDRHRHEPPRPIIVPVPEPPYREPHRPRCPDDRCPREDAKPEKPMPKAEVGEPPVGWQPVAVRGKGPDTITFTQAEFHALYPAIQAYSRAERERAYAAKLPPMPRADECLCPIGGPCSCGPGCQCGRQCIFTSIVRPGEAARMEAERLARETGRMPAATYWPK